MLKLYLCRLQKQSKTKTESVVKDSYARGKIAEKRERLISIKIRIEVT